MQNELDNFCYNVLFIRNKYGLDKIKMSDLLNITITELESIERGLIPDTVSCEVVFRMQFYFRVTPKSLFDTKFS